MTAQLSRPEPHLTDRPASIQGTLALDFTPTRRPALRLVAR